MKMLTILLLVMLSGCATAPEKIQLAWWPIADPKGLCDGQERCEKVSEYHGRPACTMITKTKGLSYDGLGQQVLSCVQLIRNYR